MSLCSVVPHLLYMHHLHCRCIYIVLLQILTYMYHTQCFLWRGYPEISNTKLKFPSPSIGGSPTHFELLSHPSGIRELAKKKHKSV